MLVVLTTTPDSDEANSLARAIVDARLAACVQILPSITSVYSWNDAVRTDPENLLLIKTLDEKYSELKEFIQAHHSYEVPEIVALKAENVSESYLKWMTEMVNA